MVNIPLRDVGVEVGGLDKAQKELINDLEVRPSEFEHRFIFFGIKCIACWIDLWWDRSEQIGGKLATFDQEIHLEFKWTSIQMTRTILMTSGYICSVITPRWVVI